MPRKPAPEPAPTRDTVNINVAIPKQLHVKLKKVAAEDSMTVKDTVIRALEKWAERLGK
ncbi:MAG TPA: hypothetical protein VNQ73_14860 [Ilumatobacter sp.]|nr:hypothetical protein [Ilumatobacter sp.]